jgi:peptidoglycan/xylan/chitin deacetylase (PgdA/CDA1 family)
MRIRLVAIFALIGVLWPTTTFARAAAPSLSAVPILLYHHVDDQVGPYHLPRKLFAQQMDYLARSDYHTVTMTAYANALDETTALPDKSVVLTFDDGYDDAYTTVFPLLKSYGMTATFYIITGYVGQPGYLTWDEITEMHAAGMEFGGHTVHHVFLTALPQWLAFWEVWQSRADLQAHLGVAPVSFAYPYNDHNAAVVQMAQLAGYRVACIVDLHSGDKQPNRFAIPRITVAPGESMNSFRIVVAVGYYAPKK